jgi:hypothetical protein
MVARILLIELIILHFIMLSNFSKRHQFSLLDGSASSPRVNVDPEVISFVLDSVCASGGSVMGQLCWSPAGSNRVGENGSEPLGFMCPFSWSKNGNRTLALLA